jgi:hypothetical protein
MKVIKGSITRGVTQIYPDAKTQVRHDVYRHTFSRIRIGPTRAWKIVHWRFVPRCTRPHYVTHRSTMMQKLKFGVMCADTLFVGFAGMKNSVSTFRTPDSLEPTIWHADHTGCTKQDWHEVSRRALWGIRTRPNWAWKIVHRHFMDRKHQKPLCDL